MKKIDSILFERARVVVCRKMGEKKLLSLALSGDDETFINECLYHYKYLWDAVFAVGIFIVMLAGFGVAILMIYW